MDRTTFDFYRSHHPASCELMKDGRENQLCKTFGFEQDRGQIRVNEGLACTVPHSVVLKLLGMTRPQVRPKSSRHLGAVSAAASMVILPNINVWCEPMAFPCKQGSHERIQAPRIERRTWLALTGCTALPRTMPHTPARTARHKIKPRPQRTVRAWQAHSWY